MKCNHEAMLIVLMAQLEGHVRYAESDLQVLSLTQALAALVEILDAHRREVHGNDAAHIEESNAFGATMVQAVSDAMNKVINEKGNPPLYSTTGNPFNN